jgi:hypothetical protein
LYIFEKHSCVYNVMNCSCISTFGPEVLEGKMIFRQSNEGCSNW